MQQLRDRIDQIVGQQTKPLNLSDGAINEPPRDGGRQCEYVDIAIRSSGPLGIERVTETFEDIRLYYFVIHVSFPQ
jgi:hypothetical protein